MQTKLQVATGYSNPQFEKAANSIEAELHTFAQTEGRADALKSVQVTPLVFKVKIIDYAKTSVQKLIDQLKQEMLATSQVLAAKESEQIAKRKCELLQHDVDHLQMRLASLKRTLDSVQPDTAKRKQLMLFRVIAASVGIVDGALCYYSFKVAYPVPLAILCSIAIGATIAGSHLATVPWIRSAGTKLQQRMRIGIVVGIAVLFFGVISNMRSVAASAAVDISVTPDAAQQTSSISSLAIFVISLTLFLAVLGLAMVFWQSKEEEQKAAAFKKVADDICSTEQEIEELKKSIAETEHTVLMQKNEARQAYDFLTRGIERAKNIGQSTITLYKQTYSKFRPTIPEFFGTTPHLDIDENIHFFDPSNKQ